MVKKSEKLSVRRQCELLGLPRSRFYYQNKLNSGEAKMCNKIKETYEKHPIYGYRRIKNMLNRESIIINGKKVLRIMRKLRLKAIYPGPNTSKRNLVDQVKPYLLEGLKITRPNQVWQIDITYLRTEKGFVCLTAFIDVYTRLVIDWSVSNDLSSYSCTSLLDRAILTEKPEIINSDQGSQFTSSDWLKLLEEKGISVSMTGKGRSNDNSYIERFWRSLKYEGIYLHNLRSVKNLKQYLPKLIDWYNNERPHQSLNYLTPREFTDGYMDKLPNNLWEC